MAYQGPGAHDAHAHDPTYEDNHRLQDLPASEVRATLLCFPPWFPPGMR